MKVLFLDVDGVLNTTKSRSLYSLSKPLLRRLQTIVEQTNCKIVLSSTWRKHPEALRRLKRTLEYRGMSIYDVTPVFWRDEEGNRLYRGHEIQHWLDDHPEVISYCIVDDDSDMLDNQLRNFVQTDPDYGLTDVLVYRIVYRMNNNENSSI